MSVVGPAIHAVSACGADLACIAIAGPETTVALFDHEHPEAIVHVDLPSSSPYSTTGLLMFPLPDGDFDLVELNGFPGYESTLVHDQRLTRFREDVGPPYMRELRITGDEPTGLLLAHASTGAFAAVSAQGRLLRVEPNGDEITFDSLFPAPYPQVRNRLAGAIRSDGTVLYITGGEPANDASLREPLSLVAIHATGTVTLTPLGHWAVPASALDQALSAKLSPPPPWALRSPRITSTIQLIGDTDVLVGIEQHVPLAPDNRFELLRVSTSGEILWRREWNNGDEHGFELHSNDGRILIGSRRSDDGWIVRTLDDNGVLLDQRQPRCSGGPCRIDHMQMGRNGSVIGIGGSGFDDTQHGYRVWFLHDLFDPQPVSLDQVGLDGTWYDPAVPGQGFTLRRYASDEATTVFMPWFTFARDGGDDATALRWYTLQGHIQPGQTEADLTLLENIGGRFDDLPVTEPRPVGAARLRFADCARGMLEYRFDPEHGGAEGSIALQRLLPPEQACGEIEPTAHDPLLSASWYDPATAGQGVDLYRIAGEEGSAGVLFGSWYTYDPIEPADAAVDQHWFTLQGIADSGDEGWTTTIVQTLGGRLDATPTSNHFQVGEAVLRSVDCRNLRLEYRFDDEPDAGAFRGLEGSMELQRIGDCPDEP